MTVSPSEKVLLTVKEAAALISVSPSMVYKLIYTKAIPYKPVGPRSWRIPRAALDEWATKGAVFHDATDEP